MTHANVEHRTSNVELDHHSTFDAQRSKFDVREPCITANVLLSENPILRSHITKIQPLERLEPLARAGVPVLHVCGNYIFVCVSPQARDAAIWKQLHKIRDDYLKK